MTRPAAFAIPGDHETLTGGFIYERQLLDGLRALGHDVAHLRLAASFPDPTAADMQDAEAQLCGLEPSRPVIIDGLVFGAIATAGLARVKAPIVAMIHHPLALETGLSDARAQHLFQTERDNLRLAKAVIVPSPHTRAILTDRYGANPALITIAPPGVAPATGVSAPVDPPLILSVGLLHPRKGHDTLLQALARLKTRDWQAVIVGKEHEAGQAALLTDLRDRLGLSDRVRFAGQIEREALDVLYRRASIFALATRYEGYGMVFDEALVNGLPIVGCSVGAVPQTVPRDAGRLVPPDAPAEFAGALGALLEDPLLRGKMAAASAKAGLRRPGPGAKARIASAVLDALHAA